MKKIAAILTVYNRREKTIACLRNLFAAQDAYNAYRTHEAPEAEEDSVGLTLFITDDGCTDGTAEAVRKEFVARDIHIVPGDGSLYWAGGMRKAWQTAIDSGTPWDYYLLINDDTYIYNNVFEQLFDSMDYGYRKTGRYGMASGITCQPDSPQVITYGGLNFVNKTRGRQILVKPKGEPQRIDMTNANILLVHRSVVDTIGIFHKGFRHSCADNDYSMTASRHGLPTYSTAEVCGECVRDHYSQEDEILQLMKMSLVERKRYINSPTHCDGDYMLLVRRNMPLRYPMSWLVRTLRLYCPGIYHKITKMRGVYR